MGYVYALLSYVLWAFCPTVLNRAIPLPSAAATSAGSIIGTLVMLLVTSRKQKAEALAVARAHPRRILGYGAAFLGCSLFLQGAVRLTSVANVMIITGIQPIFTCLVALPLVGRPRPGKYGYAALALSVFGLGVLLWPMLSHGGGAPVANVAMQRLGLLLAVLSAGCYSWYVVQLDFFTGIAKDVPLLLTSLVIGSLLSLPVWLFVPAPDWHRLPWLLLLTFGVLNFAVANLLYYAGASRISRSHLSMLAYVNMPLAIVAGAAFLHEPITAPMIVGGGLVMVATAFVMLDKPRENKKKDGANGSVPQAAP